MHGLIVTLMGAGGVYGWMKYIQADDLRRVWEEKYYQLRKEHNRKFGVHYGYQGKSNYQDKPWDNGQHPNPKFPKKPSIFDVDL